MAAQNARQIKYDTDIAILQTEFKNLNEKLDRHAEETHRMMREFQHENIKQHADFATRLSKIERWRWMLIGGGVILGSSGMMGIEKLLGLH